MTVLEILLTLSDIAVASPQYRDALMEASRYIEELEDKCEKLEDERRHVDDLLAQAYSKHGR
jgi:hypothetical protein